jgi:hypothetical protein
MDKNIVFDFDETIGYFEQIIDMIRHTKKTSKIESMISLSYYFQTSLDYLVFLIDKIGYGGISEVFL